MSFSKAYYSELQRLEPLFSAAVAADKELHRAWRDGCAKLGSAEYRRTDSHARTLEQFHKTHRAINELISTAYLQAKHGDLTPWPTLFAYLVFPGRYLWSGYERARVWRLVKKLALTDEQCRILRSIVLGQIGAAGPEFVEIARAARKVDSLDFRKQIEEIGARSEKNYVSRRTSRLLALLKSNS
jgi:hypothetical protein